MCDVNDVAREPGLGGRACVRIYASRLRQALLAGVAATALLTAAGSASADDLTYNADTGTWTQTGGQSGDSPLPDSPFRSELQPRSHQTGPSSGT